MYSQPEGEGPPKKQPRKARPLSGNADTIRASSTLGEASRRVHFACRCPAELFKGRICTPHLILECGLATFFARLSDRNAAGHKPQQEACKSDFAVFKQAKLSRVAGVHCVPALLKQNSSCKYNSCNSVCPDVYTHCAGLPCPELAPGTTNTPAERTIHDWKEVFSEANVETVSSPNMLKSITEMLKILSNQNNRCAKICKHLKAIVCQTASSLCL